MSVNALMGHLFGWKRK